jgi:hypothetical protein
MEPEGGLFAAEAAGRKANLAPGFAAALAEATGLDYAEHGPPARARSPRTSPRTRELSPSARGTVSEALRRA